MPKTTDFAATGIAVGDLPAAEASEGQQTVHEEHNVYGAPPGAGISMPPYYLPPDSVNNRNVHFPSTELLDPNEMRITFMGASPGRRAYSKPPNASWLNSATASGSSLTSARVACAASSPTRCR